MNGLSQQLILTGKDEQDKYLRAWYKIIAFRKWFPVISP